MRAYGLLGIVVIATPLSTGILFGGEPLLDWSAWQKYRGAVKHPCTTIKRADLDRARENIKRYAWAKQYADRVVRRAQGWLPKLTPDFLALMIPETTPGCSGGTPCPACRAKGKPPHMHGSWSWSVSKPDQITCKFCNTVFPNTTYPETVVLNTTWGKPQTLRFCGGETFRLFSYRKGRPSFTGHVRARKAGWSARTCRNFAEAYALSGRAEFARACKQMLLRFAEVYPHWLIHEGYGYGEVADMDPRIAAEHINKLPKPELCYPPNKPDHKLYTGYWSAGRANACGMDGGFVRQLTEAYDLTCEARYGNKPVYSDKERRRIERDVLLEATILFVCDKSINNKSVGNRAATALVGMCVGHPELVRFGLDGFVKTVDQWYLPDGSTSESPAYGLMTLNGIIAGGQAFREYSDPPGYRDAAGKRIDGFNAYRDTDYGKVWEAFFNGLQGDLHYPPYADSYVRTAMRSSYVELMANNFPDKAQYRALLKEMCGPDLSKSYASYAIYYREPGLEKLDIPPLALPDILFPELRLGHLRTGPHGRESLLLLSASHWGGHHHRDSLNLYYWKEGQELLSDLGYLWDHPHKKMTYRTFAHNVVIIDGKEQRRREREGSFGLFSTSPAAKVMEASSKAYAEAKVYTRTAAIVLHGRDSYVVDLFRVEGGKQQDYVFHGITNTYTVEDVQLQASSDKVYDLKNPRKGDGAGTWRVTWDVGKDMKFLAVLIGQAGEQVIIGDGWGQRDHRNSDYGAVIPYIIRRRSGPGCKCFASLFEAYRGDASMIRAAARLPVPRTSDADTVALQVDTVHGRDYIISSLQRRRIRVSTPDGPIETDGRFAVVTIKDGKVVSSCLVEGQELRFKQQELHVKRSRGTGKATASSKADKAAEKKKQEEELLALGKAAAPELRKWVIEGARSGRRVHVYVTVMGVNTRARITAADEARISVVKNRETSEVPWDSVSPSQLYRMAKKYAAPAEKTVAAGRRKLLKAFALANGLETE